MVLDGAEWHCPSKSEPHFWCQMVKQKDPLEVNTKQHRLKCSKAQHFKNPQHNPD